MLYDGDCPLCMREVNMLRKRDKDQNKIGFVDISSPDYTPKDNAGISYEQVALVLAASTTGMPPALGRSMALQLLSLHSACKALLLHRKVFPTGGAAQHALCLLRRSPLLCSH